MKTDWLRSWPYSLPLGSLPLAIALGSGLASGCAGLPGAIAPVTPVAIASPEPVTSTVATPAPTPPAVNPAVLWQSATDKGYSAAKLAQSAQATTDWQFVALRWREAISALQQIPAASPQGPIAQTKIAEYQKNEAIARQRAQLALNQPTPAAIALGDPTSANGQPADPLPNNLNSPPPSPTGPSSITSPDTVILPIKKRLGGIPVIEVSMNGVPFLMMLDTGASSTVITQRMAFSLNLQPQGSIKVNTPSDRAVDFAISRVETLSVGTAVAKNFEVAIAPTMELGLLGQNFLSSFDVTIRREQVELHRHR